METKSRSLLNEIQFFIILISMVIVILMVGVSLYIVSYKMLVDLRARSLATANEMEAFLEHPLYVVDDEQAVRIAETFLSSGKISGIILESTANGILLSKTTGKDSLKIPKISRSIRRKGLSLGKITITFSDEEIIRTQARFVVIFLVIIISVLLANFVANRYLITRKVRRPFSNIVQAIRNIAEGNYKTLIDPTPYRDVNILVNLFNDMAGKINLKNQEQQKIEKALRESEERYLQIARCVPDVIWIMDLTGRFSYVNSAVERTHGWTVEEWLKLNYRDVVTPQQAVKDAASIEEVLMKSKAPQYDHNLIRTYDSEELRKDGSSFWAEISAVFLWSDDGKPIGIIGITRDVTARKQAEEKLKRSEERMRLFFERQLVGMAITSPEKGWLQVNDKLSRMLGYSPEELFRLTWAELTHPEDLAADVAQFDRLLPGEIEEYSLEKRFIRKDGAVIFTNLSVGCVRLPDGSLDYVLALLEDITIRKRAEEALMAERQYLIDIIDFLPDATFVIDSERRVVAWNRAAEEMTGVKRDELLGKGGYAYAVPFFGEPCPILIDLLDLPDEEREKFYKYIKRSGPSIYAESFMQRLNGGRGAHLWGVAAPLYDRYGTRTGAIEVIRDVTEHKLAEEERIRLQTQLMQSQKMEAIGQLAGGVAHDFNNMLNIILGYSQMALTKIDKSSPLHADIQEIASAGKHSADLVRQLLAFARKQTITPKLLDLNDTVAGMLNMLRKLIGEDIDLLWMPAPNLWLIKMDPAQVNQIVANLTINARDSISGVGKITIETGKAIFDMAYCAKHAGAEPGHYIMLAVSDNGCGMDKDTLGKIFEPFFTTKELGKGTGLGLATVYGIVKQNKGFIDVYSEPGKGTAFKIFIPMHGKEGIIIDEPRLQTEPLTGTETVLLVEDDEALLKMAKIMLEELGYTVLMSCTPGEAIRLAGEHAGEIHLMLTDVIMPEMSGRDLQKRICTIRPDMKYLFMSGHTANVIAQRGILDKSVNFLQKPFSIKELAAKVSEALGRG